MIKTYGRRGACRSACMDFPRGKHATPTNITLKQIQIIDTLVAKFCKAHDATPQHDTFKTPGQLLQTPATLETLGSTSAVPLHRLEAGRQHVSFMEYTVMEQPVARNLFQSLAAGIMFVEPQQSSDNSLCSHPVASKTSQSGITCHKLQKRQTLAPNSKPKFDLKNEAILASPNETIEAASQNLKLKMASVERDTKLSKPKEMRGAKKKSPNECARQPFYRCSAHRGVCQHKVPFFNQRSTRLSSCVIMPESKIIHRFFLYHVATEEVQSLVSRIIIFSEAWIGFNEFPPSLNTNVDTNINVKKSNAPVCAQSKRLLVCTTSNIKIPGAKGIHIE